ncbi:MAG: hypothetical protein M3362_26910, partial [Acidobacteriota bacterium]|nr:hypothetical protein [Acidobacteriota bacterium]
MLNRRSSLVTLTVSLFFALALWTSAAPSASAQTAPRAVAANSTTTPAPALEADSLTSAPAASRSVEPGPEIVGPEIAGPKTATALPSPASQPKPSAQEAAPPAPASEAGAQSLPQATQTPSPSPSPLCHAYVNANVMAISQPYMLNRLGAAMPNAQIFALASDVNPTQLQLYDFKRARPVTLRVNVGDCLRINLTNSLYQYPPLT